MDRSLVRAVPRSDGRAKPWLLAVAPCSAELMARQHENGVVQVALPSVLSPTSVRKIPQRVTVVVIEYKTRVVHIACSSG